MKEIIRIITSFLLGLRRFHKNYARISKSRLKRCSYARQTREAVSCVGSELRPSLLHQLTAVTLVGSGLVGGGEGSASIHIHTLYTYI